MFSPPLHMSVVAIALELDKFFTNFRHGCGDRPWFLDRSPFVITCAQHAPVKMVALQGVIIKELHLLDYGDSIPTTRDVISWSSSRITEEVTKLRWSVGASVARRAVLRIGVGDPSLRVDRAFLIPPT